MGPEVFNKVTGVFSVYRLVSYMDVGPTFSLLSYAKGDAGLPDYAPDFLPQPIGASSMRNDVLHVAWGQVHWLLLVIKLT